MDTFQGLCIIIFKVLLLLHPPRLVNRLALTKGVDEALKMPWGFHYQVFQGSVSVEALIYIDALSNGRKKLISTILVVLMYCGGQFTTFKELLIQNDNKW